MFEVASCVLYKRHLVLTRSIPSPTPRAVLRSGVLGEGHTEGLGQLPAEASVMLRVGDPRQVGALGTERKKGHGEGARRTAGKPVKREGRRGGGVSLSQKENGATLRI